MSETQKEIWKEVPGYDGAYQASTEGQIRSVSREKKDSLGRNLKFPEKIVKPQPYKSGQPYVYVDLSKDGKRVREDVSHLVLLTFVGPPEGDQQCLHKDNDPTNTRLDNLVWGSFDQNVEDRINNNRRRRGGADPKDPRKREHPESDPSRRAVVGEASQAKGKCWFNRPITSIGLRKSDFGIDRLIKAERRIKPSRMTTTQTEPSHTESNRPNLTRYPPEQNTPDWIEEHQDFREPYPQTPSDEQAPSDPIIHKI